MTNTKSTAIYHTVKITNSQIKKRVQGEARIVDKYVESVETKFEFALFNAPKDISYSDLFIYFRAEWLRIVEVISKKNFQFVRVNKNHFDNFYAPVKL